MRGTARSVSTLGRGVRECRRGRGVRAGRRGHRGWWLRGSLRRRPRSRRLCRDRRRRNGRARDRFAADGHHDNRHVTDRRRRNGCSRRRRRAFVRRGPDAVRRQHGSGNVRDADDRSPALWCVRARVCGRRSVFDVGVPEFVCVGVDDVHSHGRADVRRSHERSTKLRRVRHGLSCGTLVRDVDVPAGVPEWSDGMRDALRGPSVVDDGLRRVRSCVCGRRDVHVGRVPIAVRRGGSVVRGTVRRHAQ